jgi:hypothetical protein
MGRKNIFDPGDEDLHRQRTALVDDGVSVIRANRMYWNARTRIEQLLDGTDVECDQDEIHVVTGAVLLLYRRHFDLSNDETVHLAKLQDWLDETDSVIVYAFCVAYEHVDSTTVETIRREYSPIE